jgi:hypothetical protein
MKGGTMTAHTAILGGHEPMTPDYQLPTIEICIVDSKGETLYTMRLGRPENQYFSIDGKPLTKEEAGLLSSASEKADLPS